GLVAEAVPWGDRVVSVVGALPDGRLRVLAAADAQGVHGRNQAGEIRSSLRWPGGRGCELPVRLPPRAVVELGAALCAAQLAGAMRSALRLVVRHAGDREQFGRPIGRFQAVQQQLALMAER